MRWCRSVFKFRRLTWLTFGAELTQRVGRENPKAVTRVTASPMCPSGPTTIPPGLIVPLALAQFPNDWPSDRALAERQYSL
jgi:hypothetical protein